MKGADQWTFQVGRIRCCRMRWKDSGAFQVANQGVEVQRPVYVRQVVVSGDQVRIQVHSGKLTVNQVKIR